MFKVKCLADEALVPTKGSKNAAGYDIYSLDDCIILPGEIRAIPTGLVFEIPLGYYGQIASRSSLAVKGITTLGGVIDADYRGEVKIILHNQSDSAFTIKPRERLAQIILIKIFNEQDAPIRVSTLTETERNSGGFGSTGK